ncbi:MAG: hypothetical protein SR1Q5_00120 [Quinella sp. 1Q5]|nr:hypothetical protein [Quinella sp. 1Q5]
MKLYPDTKVYVSCPANFQTGGPELAHQLASTLISFGVKAGMCYYKSAKEYNKEDPVHDVYKKYHVPYTFEMEDKPHNIFVVPEGATELFYGIKKMRRVLWWMSVDNYLSHLVNVFNAYLKDTLAKPLAKLFCFGKEDNDVEHFVQSEYARQFIKLNGIPNNKIHMVEDYLNQAFLTRAAQVDLSKKENIVAYNPKKGFEVVKLFIADAPDIDWRPIKDMTPAQVQELLASAKVYIDFGNHPGKDRIPREAAVSGCVVLVGKRGAAINDIDINIPAEFKFDMAGNTLQDVINKIHEVFEDFPAAHEKQTSYRARIHDDKNRFVNEVVEAFEIKKTNRGAVALPQGFNEGTSLLIEKLQRQSLMPGFIVDDFMSTAEMAKLSEGLIIRDQNRNYMRLDDNLIEIITRDDAKFLHIEGRISKLALSEPSEAELAAVKDFYEADDSAILRF